MTVIQGLVVDFTVNPGLYNPYLNSKRHYYKVHIYNTKKAMWLSAAKLSSFEKDSNGGFGALTIPSYRQRRDGNVIITAPKIGDVLFYRGLLGSGVIAHESVHMATSFLRIFNSLKLGDKIDDREENLAYCIGSCTRQIVDKLYKFEVL